VFLSEESEQRQWLFRAGGILVKEGRSGLTRGQIQIRTK
jgi:hypothetical protein